ncbi:MAG: LysM peptidoglycan-binding domain-containing protein, partial [Rhodoferax sp.]
FRRNLKAYSDGQLASWTAWTTTTTMKASDAARRVGMDESEFRSINHIPPRMMIKVGSTLLVPSSDRVESDVTEHVADNGQLALAPEPPPITLHRTTVKAHRGDSLAALARRYGQSVDSVAGWNHMRASASLKAGQHLVVYLPVKARTAHTLTAYAGKRSEVRTVARVHSHSAEKIAARTPSRAPRVKAVARTHTAPTRRVAKSSTPHRVHQTLVASESR